MLASQSVILPHHKIYSMDFIVGLYLIVPIISGDYLEYLNLLVSSGVYLHLQKLAKNSVTVKKELLNTHAQLSTD